MTILERLRKQIYFDRADQDLIEEAANKIIEQEQRIKDLEGLLHTSTSLLYRYKESSEKAIKFFEII